jgi:hypothetical protein
LYAISQQIFYYSKLQNITKRKLQIEILILTLFTAFTTDGKFPIEILILTLFTAFTTDGKFPMGKFAGARIFTDEETEISSELPGCIAVLLAV